LSIAFFFSPLDFIAKLGKSFAKAKYVHIRHLRLADKACNIYTCPYREKWSCAGDFTTSVWQKQQKTKR
jgi:hypothetical protein